MSSARHVSSHSPERASEGDQWSNSSIIRGEGAADKGCAAPSVADAAARFETRGVVVCGAFADAALLNAAGCEDSTDGANTVAAAPCKVFGAAVEGGGDTGASDTCDLASVPARGLGAEGALDHGCFGVKVEGSSTVSARTARCGTDAAERRLEKKLHACGEEHTSQRCSNREIRNEDSHSAF